MYSNKDNKFNHNADTSQNEQEQFAAYNAEESECKYPEQINKEIVTPEDTSTYAFNWEMSETPKSEVKEEPKKQKAKKSRLWVQTLIMGISFIIAFIILSFTLINGQRNSGMPDVTTDGQINSTAETEAGKTIYIKEYDDASGVLTPQEIYSSSLPSVISIKASSDTLQSIGSGFVFDSNGYIATAHHVVDGMSEITVITQNKQEFPATLVASDELTDLALLKIDCDTLTALEFGKSSELLVGDKLFAIGTPASLEFSGTMSGGDVSYTDRTVSIYNENDGTLRKKMTLIQTTAALNPGNSGGPVFDCYGKLVGIVTMKLGNSFDGISFVIPSDGAYPILCDMRDGITLSDQKRAGVANYAAKMGVIGEKYSDGTRLGVRVIDFVSEECDAAKKIRIGDVIVSLDGTPIPSVSALSEAINNHIPGDSVSVTVYRSEQLLTFSIILGR